jgi:EF hand domain-containing protein
MKVKTCLAVSFLVAMFLIFSIDASAVETTPTDGPQNFINRWDTNDDGKVSKEEFDGPDDHFANFDKNEDGSIDKAEAPKGPPGEKGKNSRGPGGGGPGGNQNR